MLRHWNYRDYYHPSINGDDEVHILSHVGKEVSTMTGEVYCVDRIGAKQFSIDHCFEMLRQSALCHADGSLTTFKWHPEKKRPMFNASESIHRCVNWESFTNSFVSRVVTTEEIGRLHNPLM